MGRVGACLLGLVCALACQSIVGIEDTSVREPGGDASAGSSGAGGGGAGGTNGGSAGSGGASANGGGGGTAGGAGDAGGDVAGCDDFSVVQPAAVEVVQGNSFQVDVQVSLGSCFTSPIDVSAPPVNEVSIQPLTLPAMTTSGSLTVQTQASTPFGTAVLKLTFSGGGKSHEVDLNVTVKGKPGEPVVGFNNYMGPGSVRALAVDTNGDIVVGLNPGGSQSGWGIARLNEDGSVDPSFSQPTMPSSGALTDLALGSNGVIVTAGDVTTGNGGAVMRMSASGTPDPQLGSDGTYVIPTSEFPSTCDPRAVFATSDGKILTAGSVQTLAMFARVDPTIVDPIDKIDIGYALGDAANWFVAATPSRIVTAGTWDYPTPPNIRDVYLRAVAPADGDLDGSFGNAGTVIYDVSDEDLVFDGVLTQNAIYLVGAIENEPGWRPTLFHVSPDGKTVKHTAAQPPSAQDYQYYGVAVQADGRIVAVGASVNGIYSVVSRFDADGKLDTTFGTGQSGSKVFGNGLDLRAVAIASDGRILVGGADSNGAIVLELWN